jgi:hypothetical protein
MDNLNIGKMLGNRVKRFCVSVNHCFSGHHGRSGILVSGWYRAPMWITSGMRGLLSATLSVQFFTLLMDFMGIKIF